MRAAWVEENPRAAKALLMAVLEALQWCDKDENKNELAVISAKRQWITFLLRISTSGSRAILTTGTDGSKKTVRC